MSMSSGYAALPMHKVENFCGGVRVTIERTVFVKLSVSGQTGSQTSDVTSSVTSMSPVKLTERQQDMLELIRKNPFISAQQMSVVLSVVKRTIERDLADLQKKGILIREGNTSAGHWEIIEKQNCCLHRPKNGTRPTDERDKTER